MSFMSSRARYSYSMLLSFLLNSPRAVLFWSCDPEIYVHWFVIWWNRLSDPIQKQSWEYLKFSTTRSTRWVICWTSCILTLVSIHQKWQFGILWLLFMFISSWKSLFPDFKTCLFCMDGYRLATVSPVAQDHSCLLICFQLLGIYPSGLVTM